MMRRKRPASDEDTDPAIRLDARGVFARLFPKVDSWMQNNRNAGRLLKEASGHEERARDWKARGHYERAGFCLERASRAVGSSMDIRFSLESHRRHAELLRGALSCYEREMEERHDPGIRWGMYRVARAMGDGKAAAGHFAAAVQGFERMVHDPSFDARVRLGRLKRKFLERACERDVLSAVILACEAMDAASEFRTKPAEKVEEVRQWAIGRFAEETGGQSELFMGSVGTYMPRRLIRP